MCPNPPKPLFMLEVVLVAGPGLFTSVSPLPRRFFNGVSASVLLTSRLSNCFSIGLPGVANLDDFPLTAGGGVVSLFFDPDASWSEDVEWERLS